MPDHYLTRRLPVAVRLDGRAFHTYVRRIGLMKPFDERLMVAMSNTMYHLIEGREGTVVGLTQSDEISVILVDDKGLETQPWFGNRLQKIVSIAAAMCTLEFN